jgi:hypothetical protein
MNDHLSIKRSCAAVVLLVVAFATGTGTSWAQGGPDVVHTGIECIPQTQFALLTASIRPGEEIQVARVYFRSNMYPDFYYVDMTGTGEAFQAILPKPSPETAQVIYYIEAVDVGFSSNRTVEHSAEVVEDEDDCRRRDPAAAYYTGGNPGIVVGALKSGMPPVPAGFLAEGITGFIPLSGSGGGGAGATAALAIGGAAAGAVGVGVLVAGGNQATTTTSAVVSPPPAPSTTTSTPSTPPSSPAVEACFDTSPASGVIEIGERIKLDARCSEPKGSLSYHWDLGDGRSREGVFIEPSYSSPGTYAVVLTVRRTTSFQGLGQTTEDDVDTMTRQITVMEPNDADLAVMKTSSPNPYDPFDEIPLTYTITVENLGPATAVDVTLVDTLPPEMMVLDNGGCVPSGTSRLLCALGDLDNGDAVEVTIELAVDYQQEPELGPYIENRVEVGSETMDPDTSNNSAVARTNLLWEQRVSSLELAFTSLLDFGTTDRPSVGHVVLNGGRVDTTMGGTSFPHRDQGRPGRNTIEAYPVAGAGRDGTWRFDFSATRSFVAGSFRTEMGQVVSQDTQGIVFRLSGQAGERLRFSFELSPRGR